MPDIPEMKAEDVRDELRETKDVISTRAKLTKAESAASFRAKDLTIQEIRVALEFDSDNEVRHAIESVLADSLDNYDREKLRQQVDSRLELLWRLAYKRANDDKNPYRHHAEKQALAVLHRISELHGLDAPKEVRLHHAADHEIHEWIQTIRERESRPALPAEADIIDVTEETDD